MTTETEARRSDRRDHHELIVRRTFATYRRALEDWARRKPLLVSRRMEKLREQASVGGSGAALELAILDAWIAAKATP